MDNQNTDNKIQQNEAQQPENATAQPTAEQGAEQTEQKQPTSYAVRPQHRRLRPLAYSDQNNMLKVLAIVGVILWTQLEESRNIAYIVLIVGVVLKIAEVCIRLFKK